MHTSVSYVDLSSPGKDLSDQLELRDEERGHDHQLDVPLLSSPTHGHRHHHGFKALDKFEPWLRIGVAVAVCLSWTFVSSMAIIVNRKVMVEVGFKFPTTIAFSGLLTTTSISYIAMLFLVPRHKRVTVTLDHYLYRILPTGLMMALTFNLGNTAYLYLTVAFVQMLKATCPVITLFLLHVSGMEMATPKLIGSIALISCGVAMASYGELNMNFIGMTTMLASTLAESSRLVMTQHLLSGQAPMHPFEGLCHIGGASSFCLFLLAVAFEWKGLLEQRAWRLALENPATFILAAFAGFGVNALAILVIKLTSSLTLKVLGTVKDACLITASVLFLREVVSSLQLLGYSISLIGFLAYNFIKATSSSATKEHAPKTQ